MGANLMNFWSGASTSQGSMTQRSAQQVIWLGCRGGFCEKSCSLGPLLPLAKTQAAGRLSTAVLPELILHPVLDSFSYVRQQG